MYFVYTVYRVQMHFIHLLFKRGGTIHAAAIGPPHIRGERGTLYKILVSFCRVKDSIHAQPPA